MGVYRMSKIFLTTAAILLLSGSAALAQMRPGAMAAARACRPDIRQFCGDVAPGQGRIKACMKAHIGGLSEPCKEALFQFWLRQ
jgi:Cysteine rich repeat